MIFAQLKKKRFKSPKKEEITVEFDGSYICFYNYVSTGLMLPAWKNFKCLEQTRLHDK